MHADYDEVWLMYEEYGEVWLMYEDYDEVWLMHEDYGEVWLMHEEYSEVWLMYDKVQLDCKGGMTKWVSDRAASVNPAYSSYRGLDVKKMRLSFSVAVLRSCSSNYALAGTTRWCRAFACARVARVRGGALAVYLLTATTSILFCHCVAVTSCNSPYGVLHPMCVLYVHKASVLHPMYVLYVYKASVLHPVCVLYVFKASVLHPVCVL